MSVNGALVAAGVVEVSQLFVEQKLYRPTGDAYHAGHNAAVEATDALRPPHLHQSAPRGQTIRGAQRLVL